MFNMRERHVVCSISSRFVAGRSGDYLPPTDRVPSAKACSFN